MRPKNTDATAFTLLEILLSTIIFLISVMGIFVTLSAVRGPVANKENQLAAAVFSKQVLEALYSQVNNATYYNDTCNGGTSTAFDLSVCSHQVSQATLSAAGLTWPTVLATAPCSTTPTLSYTVSCSDGSNNCVPTGSSPDMARTISLNIPWPNVETGVCT